MAAELKNYQCELIALRKHPLQADEIIVKPFETKTLADFVREKLLTPKLAIQTPNERGGNIAAMHERDRGRLVGQGQKEQGTQPRYP